MTTEQAVVKPEVRQAIQRETAERIIQRLHAEAWRTAPPGLGITGWFDIGDASRICGEEAGHSDRGSDA